MNASHNPETAASSAGGIEYVMYHRVWRSAALDGYGLKLLPYLSFDDFRRQLDWLENNGGIVKKHSGCVDGKWALTFDDGLRCHETLVYPELCSRGIEAGAMFFVPGLPFCEKKVCGIQRVHEALGRGDLPSSLGWARLKYTTDGEALATDVGLDWYVSPEWLQSCESIVGSHGYRHLALSMLVDGEIMDEIDWTTGRSWFFSYPYGGVAAYSEYATLVASLLYEKAFDVNPVEQHDMYRVPRIDCNKLPHGKSTMGR